MTDELRNAADWADAIEIDAESIDIDGEPKAALDHVEDRIADLEAVLEDLDTLDPQPGPVHLELGTLRATQAALREQVDLHDQEGDDA